MATLNLKDFDGVKMPAEFELVRKRLESLEVRNDDVWLTSYPKTGTTWAQEMVWLIGNDLDYERAKTEVLNRFPYIEYHGFLGGIERFIKEHKIESNYTDPKVDFVDVVEKIEGTRYIKTHLPWEFLPRQIKDGSKKPKLIHIMRNPKQVATSYYNHAAVVFPMFLGTLDEFIDLYVKSGLLYGDYFRTVLSYWKQRHLENILILTFEEMRSDISAVIRKVSDFLGKSYNDEQIKKLAHHLSFEEMKKNPAVNAQTFIQDESKQFINKGAIDSYKQELTPEMIEKLDRWVKRNIKGTGLPYENC